MRLGPTANLAPPAVWLPAPLFCPRLACRPSPCCGGSLQQLGKTHRGGTSLTSDSRGDRREPVMGQRSRGSLADSLHTAASIACDAASAPHGRLRTAHQASATAVCDRPSSEAEARASQPAQYPWAVDPAWSASAAAAETSSSSPRRPCGAGRRGVPVQRDPDRAPATDARRDTAQGSGREAPPRHSTAPGGLGVVRAPSDAERLAHTVRCLLSAPPSLRLAFSQNLPRRSHRSSCAYRSSRAGAHQMLQHLPAHSEPPSSP